MTHTQQNWMTNSGLLITVVQKLKGDGNKRQSRKKNHFFFTWGASNEGKISLIKVAYFVLNFLNLKNFSSHLFWGVASSLSIL